MYGMSVREVRGRASLAPFIDRVIDGGPDAVTAPEDALSVREYLDLMLAGSFPEPSLRMPATARRRWFAGYVEQMITRDVPAVAPRRAGAQGSGPAYRDSQRAADRDRDHGRRYRHGLRRSPSWRAAGSPPIPLVLGSNSHGVGALAQVQPLEEPLLVVLQFKRLGYFPAGRAGSARRRSDLHQTGAIMMLICEYAHYA
jgi:hypothetical protein